MEGHYKSFKDIIKKLNFLSKNFASINQRVEYEKDYSYFPKIYSKEILLIDRDDYINIDVIDLRKYIRCRNINSCRYIELHFDPSGIFSIIENKIYLPFKIDDEFPETLIEFSLQYGRIPEYLLKNIDSVNLDITRLCCEYMWRE